nr:hypothetical protein Dp_00004 [Serratia proteamaculans]
MDIRQEFYAVEGGDIVGRAGKPGAAVAPGQLPQCGKPRGTDVKCALQYVEAEGILRCFRA